MKNITLIDNQELAETLKQAVRDGLLEFTQKQDLPVLLTTEGLCKMLDISVRTAQNYRDKSIIPYLKVGRKIYYKPEEVLLAVKPILECLSQGSRNESVLRIYLNSWSPHLDTQ